MTNRRSPYPEQIFSPACIAVSVVIVCLSFTLFPSCTALNIVRYYDRNGMLLDSICGDYKKACKTKPFSIEYTDRSFSKVSLELITDSLKYIYEFERNEQRMKDTLLKYGYDPAVFLTLTRQMQSGQCTWINQLDYYTGEQREHLTYVSLWARHFTLPFINKKYCILAFFDSPQFFDDKGNLLAGRRRRRVRKINTNVFKRINDTVCYTLSDRFR